MKSVQKTQPIARGSSDPVGESLKTSALKKMKKQKMDELTRQMAALNSIEDEVEFLKQFDLTEYEKLTAGVAEETNDEKSIAEELSVAEDLTNAEKLSIDEELTNAEMSIATIDDSKSISEMFSSITLDQVAETNDLSDELSYFTGMSELESYDAKSLLILRWSSAGKFRPIMAFKISYENSANLLIQDFRYHLLNKPKSPSLIIQWELFYVMELAKMPMLDLTNGNSRLMKFIEHFSSLQKARDCDTRMSGFYCKLLVLLYKAPIFILENRVVEQQPMKKNSSKKA
jgi:hypothetical protein